MACLLPLLAVAVLGHVPSAWGIRMSLNKVVDATVVRMNGKNTSSAAKMMAAEEFVELLGSLCSKEHPSSFEFRGVSGQCSVPCGKHTYTGPVDGIGYGAHGVTVAMHKDGPQGPKVVAKLFKGKTQDENLNHECNILQTLKTNGVNGVLECAGACENNGYPMIIVEPFLEGRKSFFDAIDESFFKSPETAKAAMLRMMKIAMSMLSAGIANIDQGHNMLFSQYGQVTFIDMGLAADLRVIWEPMIGYHVKTFMKAITKKIPATWYNDGRFDALMRDVTLPTTPPAVASRGQTDIAALVEEVIAEKRGRPTKTAPVVPKTAPVVPKPAPVAPLLDRYLDGKSGPAFYNPKKSKRQCFSLVPKSFLGTWESSTGEKITIKDKPDALEIEHPAKGTKTYAWQDFCVAEGYNGLQWEGLKGTMHKLDPDVITWNPKVLASTWIRKSWLTGARFAP